jgi:hypothetical protein|tara:strand:+ start:6809 stop:7606 length:798 start_codon:yes stop_codon:yes gene_type:complete
MPEDIRDMLENPPEETMNDLANLDDGEPVMLGLAEPTVDELLAKASAVVAELQIQEGDLEKGYRPAHITLFKATDGAPRRCTLKYTDGDGTDHDWGRHYLRKRFTHQNYPEGHPEMIGKPVFTIRPPESAPMMNVGAAECQACRKKFNDEYVVEIHMKKRHPTHWGRMDRERESSERMQMADAITALVASQQRMMEKMIAGMSGAAVSREGKFVTLTQGAEFYEITPQTMGERLRKGTAEGVKNDLGHWQVFIEDSDWEPAAKEE